MIQLPITSRPAKVRLIYQATFHELIGIFQFSRQQIGSSNLQVCKFEDLQFVIFSRKEVQDEEGNRKVS